MNQPTARMLADGPWDPSTVSAEWLDEHFDPGPELSALADAEIAALRDRGSPSHDGLAARLVGWEQTDGVLSLSLQPSRWALRLLDGPEHGSISVLCTVRSADGRWLAGRRAEWLASWPGRWALGAGGAVDLGEQPVVAMTRELEEEWSVAPASLSVEALVRVPSGMALLVGSAVLEEGAEVVPDHEHDEFEWWPADISQWPEHADAPLRTMASFLSR